MPKRKAHSLSQGTWEWPRKGCPMLRNSDKELFILQMRPEFQTSYNKGWQQETKYTATACPALSNDPERFPLKVVVKMI